MAAIYKITSPTGKIYIGQSWHIVRRLQTYKRLECKNQHKLYNSLVNHGIDAHNIEVIYEFPDDISQEVLDSYEIFYWNQFIEAGYDMLNLKEPGSRGRDSEEIRQKKSLARKGKSPSQAWLDSRRGRKLTSEHIENLKKAKAVISEETRRKMSEAKKGKPSWNKGKKASEEHRKKLSTMRKGVKRGPYKSKNKAI